MTCDTGASCHFLRHNAVTVEHVMREQSTEIGQCMTLRGGGGGMRVFVLPTVHCVTQQVK